jgi:ABC-type multidrug transport system permease subunit
MPMPVKVSIVLMLFLAANAIGGARGILSDPNGAFLNMSSRDLAGSPFSDFLIPGLVLLIVLGFGSAAAALLLWRLPGRFSWLFAVGISTSLVVWIAIQVAIIGYRGWLQPFCALLGVSMLALLMARTSRTHSCVPRQ